MLMNELICSCSHEAVADAALVSIGPQFHARVARKAHREGISAGAYAARAVRRFREQANVESWTELCVICAGEDMPILRGLHHIVEAAMEEDGSEPCQWPGMAGRFGVGQATRAAL